MFLFWLVFFCVSFSFTFILLVGLKTNIKNKKAYIQLINGTLMTLFLKYELIRLQKNIAGQNSKKSTLVNICTFSNLNC